MSYDNQDEQTDYQTTEIASVVNHISLSEAQNRESRAESQLQRFIITWISLDTNRSDNTNLNENEVKEVSVMIQALNDEDDIY